MSYITKQCELGRLLIWFLIFFGSAIRISRKGWHMLLNFCFHTALTFAVFAGGINRIKYPIICQAVSAFPFHSSGSESLTENWLWVSAQVSVVTAESEGRMHIIWSLVYCHADTIISATWLWPNLCVLFLFFFMLMLFEMGPEHDNCCNTLREHLLNHSCISVFISFFFREKWMDVMQDVLEERGRRKKKRHFHIFPFTGHNKRCTSLFSTVERHKSTLHPCHISRKPHTLKEEELYRSYSGDILHNYSSKKNVQCRMIKLCITY